MWVARDKDGYLYLYLNKPIKTKEGWNSSNLMHIDDSLFPNLTWEDEPEEIVISMKNPAIKHTCCKCGKEFKYKREDIKEWHDCQPSSGYEYGADYVNCPHCGGYNELNSW